jgi:hypothetical protein
MFLKPLIRLRECEEVINTKLMLALGIFVLIILIVGLSGCGSTDQGPILFSEDFEQGRLDFNQWEVTIDGDFAEAIVDVVDVNPSEDTDYRLRLGANTIDTSDQIKFLGVMSRNPVDLSSVKSVSFDLDWNNQVNGCYLTAAFYLCPTSSENPREESDWLKFEYAGVPPGRNVRMHIWEKADDITRQLITDWGPNDEQGRPLGRALGLQPHRIELIFSADSLRCLQDSEEIIMVSDHSIAFTEAYLYCQMSSGTNYPFREIYFDNIVVNEH